MDLDPAAAWLLIRYDRDPGLRLTALGRAHALGHARLEAADRELRARGLVEERAAPAGPGVHRTLTDAGCAVLEKLVAARREHLREVLAEWQPEQREALAARLRELVPDAPAAA